MDIKGNTGVLEANHPRDVTLLAIHLQAKLGGRVRDLRVVLTSRGIILRGFARTYHAKQLAQHGVMAETDLPILANEIQVT